MPTITNSHLLIGNGGRLKVSDDGLLIISQIIDDDAVYLFSRRRRKKIEELETLDPELVLRFRQIKEEDEILPWVL